MCSESVTRSESKNMCFVPEFPGLSYDSEHLEENCSTCLLRVLNYFNSLNELCVTAAAAGAEPARPRCDSALTHTWAHDDLISS